MSHVSYMSHIVTNQTFNKFYSLSRARAPSLSLSTPLPLSPPRHPFFLSLLRVRASLTQKTSGMAKLAQVTRRSCRYACLSSSLLLVVIDLFCSC